MDESADACLYLDGVDMFTTTLCHECARPHIASKAEATPRVDVGEVSMTQRQNKPARFQVFVRVDGKTLVVQVWEGMLVSELRAEIARRFMFHLVSVMSRGEVSHLRWRRLVWSRTRVSSCTRGVLGALCWGNGSATTAIGVGAGLRENAASGVACRGEMQALARLARPREKAVGHRSVRLRVRGEGRPRHAA